MKRRTFLTAAMALTATKAASETSGAGDLSPAAFKRSQKVVALPQGQIAYFEAGKGQAALFLHGYPLNGFQWRHQLLAFLDRRRCIAPDLLGIGATRAAAGQPVTPADQAAMLADFLDRLGVEQVDLVANDSGGAVAQLFLVRHPDRVRSLLLTNCDTELDCPPPQLAPLFDLARNDTLIRYYFGPSLADKIKARGPQGLIGATFTRPEAVRDETIDMYLAPMVAHPAAANAYLLGLEANCLAGIEAKLRTVRTPVRIVWGTGDTVFSPDSPDYLTSLFPNARGVRYIEGARLFFPEEFPNEVTAELSALWGA